MMKHGFLAAGAAVAVLGLSAAVARAQSAEDGRRISKLWCSECHVIADEAPAGRTAPTFTAIAERIPLSETYVDTWLKNPRRPMHRFRLTPRMVADIVAYLQTLRKK